MKQIITPPEHTTSDIYHNKMCELKHEKRDIDRQIIKLTADSKRLQLQIENYLAAKKNSERYERKNNHG